MDKNSINDFLGILEYCQCVAISFGTDPSNSDTDGDSYDDDIDYYPLKQNEECIYIIYDQVNFTDIATYWSNQFEDCDNVFLVEAFNINTFLDTWNSMGRVNGKYKYYLSEVILIYHGFDGYMIFDNEMVITTEWQHQYYLDCPIVESLNPTIIGDLRLIICESGTIERNNPASNYNLAVGFLLGDSTIESVIAPDGTYHVHCNRLGYQEQSWSSERGLEDYLIQYSLIDDQIVWEQYEARRTGVYRYLEI